MAAHAFIASTQGTSRPAWSTKQVQDSQGYDAEKPYLKKKKKKKNQKTYSCKGSECVSQNHTVAHNHL